MISCLKKLNVVELYAGTGRSMAPFKLWRATTPALLVDSNHYAAETYRHNHPNSPYHTGDLSTISSNKLLRLAGGRVDILLGCPPCQGYSDGGKRQSRDPRNAHITRFFQYVRDLRPRAIAIENVPLAAASTRFHAATRELDALGYNWTATIANAALWGSCQSRQRLILIGIRKGAGDAPRVPKPTHGAGRYFSYSSRDVIAIEDDYIGMLGITPASARVAFELPEAHLRTLGSKPIPTISDVIGDLPKVGSSSSSKMSHFRWAHTPAILRRMEKVEEGSQWVGGKRYFSQTYGRLHRRGLARTITTCFPNPGSGRFWHPTENRSLTLREAARIQGFPDNFEFLDSNSANCVLVGNALDQALANLTYRIIRSSLD